MPAWTVPPLAFLLPVACFWAQTRRQGRPQAELYRLVLSLGIAMLLTGEEGGLESCWCPRGKGWGVGVQRQGTIRARAGSGIGLWRPVRFRLGRGCLASEAIRQASITGRSVVPLAATRL